MGAVTSDERFRPHPRPQLARPGWRDLSGRWSFAYDDAEVGLTECWQERVEPFDRTITVPFPPESVLSGIGDRRPHPVLWYRRAFSAGAPAHDQIRLPGDRLLLHFGAVDYRASVWVNGRFVAGHEGGHTPFSTDITAALRDDGGEEVLVVRAEDRAEDVTQPRGKQFWGTPPSDVWYHRTSGIWQPVWLEWVGEANLAEVRWTPHLDRWLVGMEVRVDGPVTALTLDVRLTLGDDVLVDDSYRLNGAELRRELGLSSAVPSTRRSRELLWSPEHPNLVAAHLVLRDGDDVLDEVHSYLGLRTVAISDGRFLLNGLPYYPRLVLYQGYWPDSHLAAPDDEALRAEVERIKELGFNGVRLHQKIEDPRFLHFCDRLGLLVWGEMPSAYHFSVTAVERLTSEWMEVLRRDYSHPCIVTWVPFNESWGVPGVAREQAQQDYVKALYHLTRAIDPTRPVIGNDGWEHVRSDVWGIHDYVIDGAVLKERYGSPEAVERTIREVQPGSRALGLPDHHRVGEPVMLTECGGITLVPEAGAQWFGYGTVPDAEAFVAKYAELVSTILDCPTIAGFCYTQLTDVEHETNGLLYADRSPKVPAERIAAINGQPARSLPAEAVEANRIINLSGRE